MAAGCPRLSLRLVYSTHWSALELSRAVSHLVSLSVAVEVLLLSHLCSHLVEGRRELAWHLVVWRMCGSVPQ